MATTNHLTNIAIVGVRILIMSIPTPADHRLTKYRLVATAAAS